MAQMFELRDFEDALLGAVVLEACPSPGDFIVTGVTQDRLHDLSIPAGGTPTNTWVVRHVKHYTQHYAPSRLYVELDSEQH